MKKCKKTTATLIVRTPLIITLLALSMLAALPIVTVSATTQEYIIEVEVGRENYSGPEVDLDDPSDPYDGLGNIRLEVSYGEDNVVFTITTPEGMIGSTPETYSGSVAFIIDEDADDTTDWQVLYEPGSAMFSFDGVWGYEEAEENGQPPSPRAFVDATTVDDIEVARDGANFVLSVSFEKLGGFGSSFKFGFYISVLTEYWGGIPGGAGQVMIFFPYFEDFDWANTTNFPTGTIPIPPAATEVVQELLDDGVLNKGQANSLLVKIEKGNRIAFENEVNALWRGHILTEVQRDQLLEAEFK